MILLFGGKFGGASGAAFLSDTWGFSSNHWTNLTASLTSESPGARAGASMASLNSSAPVLFGGHNGSSVDSDTWSFQGSNWTNLTSSAGPGPPARSASAFAGDPADGELVLFGGSSSSGGYLGDTWTLRGGVWSREAIEGPPGTHGAGMAVDSEDGYVLLYGGSILQSGETGTTNAYWSYHAGVWHLWNPAPAQPFDWLILLFPGLIAVFGTEFYVLRRRQQKRLAALNDLMPQVPSETTWIPTAPPSLMSASSRRAAVIMYAVMAPMVVFFLLVIGTTTQGPGTPNSLGLLIGLPAFLMVLPALLVLGMRGSDTRSIGVSDAGVVVRRAKQELRLPWDYVQPPRINPKGPWVYFGFVLPGRQSVPSGFNATHDQARAILSHPRATVWTIPPPIREALGLATPTQPVVPQPAPGSPGTAPLAGNRKSTPLRVGAMPTYPAGPTPPVPPVMVAPLPGGAPQVRRCPRCSRLSGIRSRFCPNCGQALG